MRAISGIDNLSEVICNFSCGRVKYCWMAPSISTELSAVRSASLSTNSVSFSTDRPPESALSASSGSDARNDTCEISSE